MVSSTIIERSVSMERIDMLGDSFLSRVARALRAYLVKRGTDGARVVFAARRCKVSISHLLPLGDGWRVVLRAAVRCSRMLAPR